MSTHVMLWNRESRGNRTGDGIRPAGAGSGRDRAGTLPAEGYLRVVRIKSMSPRDHEDVSILIKGDL